MGNVVFEEVIIVYPEHPLVALEGTPAGDRYTWLSRALQLVIVTPPILFVLGICTLLLSPHLPCISVLQ